MCEWRLLKPLDWSRYVNKEVRVTAHEKQQHEGWVYTVDPVSASIVLVSSVESGPTTVKVVMGHAVETVEVLRDGDGEEEEDTARRLRAVFLPREEARRFSAEELQRRKESLRLWLDKNRVPVEVQGDALRVANVLTVRPPYGADDCSGPNEIILARVQSLVQNNPGDS